MSEIEQEVKTFSVRYQCDDCGIGEMAPTGIMFMTHPPQYPHKCDKCGTERTFAERHPKVITRT
ncbi:hypothetical protein [Zavarzinella formosa]|uniref:hypothetical protein n=1 Tax=Zavarzinella formosa TaxID=360055 RepID=UPI000312A469|nr:hypothetical protein [Zavarzinella formosa]